MQALLWVLNDECPKRIDAVFIHGSSVKDAALDTLQLKLGVQLYEHTGASAIVIPGTPQRQCGRIAYVGVEKWHKELLSMVSERTILHTPPIFHTAAECNEGAQMAVSRGWKKIIAVALPHHILRVMRSWAAVISEKNITLQVYAQTPHCLDWGMPAVKPVLDNGVSEIKGTLFDHIKRELLQGERFENKRGEDEQGKFTPHATLPELLEYLRGRKVVALT